ncbi:LPS export ABC transporter periplasmic protein LptC [Croceivirga sp. JEA036]|uniref:LPS export ABC transporter periplasmic protein LptC n=1 Tax=Flavobacteriaceae TaxID=49546 RepID=UPI00293C0304|nr:LPS export ABC transporter periplasmic protein LptC [Croceivirga sp. JEA036]
MTQHKTYMYGRFATAFAVAILFWACKDNYERVGEEAAANVFPQGVAENFELIYTQARKELSTQDSSTTRAVAILKSPLNEDYDNMAFKHRVFPKGLYVEFYDDKEQKSTITADFGMVYTQTNVIDLRGNVVIKSHDGKKLETPQLYWDRSQNWIFTEEKFTYTNEEEGTVMDGEGMDFNKEFTFFRANKTFGVMTIKDEADD